MQPLRRAPAIAQLRDESPFLEDPRAADDVTARQALRFSPSPAETWSLTIMRRISGLFPCLALGALLTACPSKEEPAQTKITEPAKTAAAPGDAKTPAADAKAPTKDTTTPTVAAHMEDHFGRSIALRDALIRGDLEAAAEPAKWMAEHETYASLPEAWKPHVQDMRNAGQLILDGADVGAKARAAGQMAAACGSCHAGLKLGPKWTGESKDLDASGRSEHMQKHLMAAELMWRGLAGPSDEAWDAGLLALGEDALVPDSLADAESPGKDVADLATKAHDLAKKGADAKDPEARAELYGEFLSTCADCHAKLDVKIALAEKPTE
jgi:hypothetical protein